MRTLMNKFDTLQKQNQPDVQTIEETKTKINELENSKIEGVKIRSRATWMEEGEKPTKYFLIWKNGSKREHA